MTCGCSQIWRFILLLYLLNFILFFSYNAFKSLVAERIQTPFIYFFWQIPYNERRKYFQWEVRICHWAKSFLLKPMTQRADLEQGSPPFAPPPLFFKGQYLMVIYLLQKNIIICTYFKSSNEDFRRTRVNNITKLRLCYYKLVPGRITHRALLLN